ncbi:hypothetical protein DFP72DRAFT_1066405 [Ephemerocybe angulata]|uniref:Uncharacterized protein n=1 Tax=Ephemerocybe angulata TaxID=980116 RepID=A0A8H6M9I0_9AGAR|nr:hypothetical protein DFP72DRAFT_1066405 [Tulosesus angulatus]
MHRQEGSWKRRCPRRQSIPTHSSSAPSWSATSTYLYSLLPPRPGLASDDGTLLKSSQHGNAYTAGQMGGTTLSVLVTVFEARCRRAIGPTILLGLVRSGMEMGLVVVYTADYTARVVRWSYSWSSSFCRVLSFYGVTNLHARRSFHRYYAERGT